MSQSIDTFEVIRANVFGSVARGEARPDSDVDFLIDVEPVTSSWFPAGLVQDLESLLGGEWKWSRNAD
jgi:hypothetical protein